MNSPTSIYSLVSADFLSLLRLLDSEQPASSNGAKPSESSCSNTGRTDLSLTTSEPSMEPSFADRMDGLMSLRAECLANLRALSDSSAELLMSAGSGPKPQEWCAKLDPITSSLRTRQRSLISNEGEPGTELCQDWPHSGMIVGGMFFPLPPLVQGISESASSLSVPTPRASANESRQTKLTPSQMAGTHGLSLQAHLISKLSSRLLPTPTARDYKDVPNMKRVVQGDRIGPGIPLPRRIYGDASIEITGGMRLTPEFLCWLMGFPPNWLKPLRSALGTPSSRKSSSRSPKPSTKD